MLSVIKILSRQHPFALGGFFLAILVMLFFAIRMVMFTVYWSDPVHRDQPIEGWMTPRYVAYSWDVPSEFIMQTLDLEKNRYDRPPSLQDIAQDQELPLDTLIETLETAIAEHRETPHD